MTDERSLVRTTCPRDCYDSCGVEVQVHRGAIVRVGGDPAHPVNRGALCGKCMHAYNGVWVDPDARLTRPLQRRGPKGAGEFEPVSWEEALGGIAEGLRRILATSRPDTILHTHYTGTCSLLAGTFPMRFFHRLGATEVDPDTVCNKAGHVVLALTFGDSAHGFDPRTADTARCIMVWGINPSASAPHVHQYWFKESHARVVVIDPVRTDTAAHADLHLQLRPGSDAALAFALLHVLARDGRIDREFIDRHTLGWGEVEPHIAGATPAWAEEVTGVPRAQIEEAARLYAAGPSLLWLGQGLQRQRLGGNIMRAASLLPIATGNIGITGAGFLYLNGSDLRGINTDYLSAPHLARTEPASVSHMDLAARLEDRDASRALITWNNNIAASSPEQRRLRQALRREDLLHVAIDLFQTDTVDYADYVLPAASFLEFDDLVLPYFHYAVSAQVGAVAPMGEALPNQEIFRRLAAAMGYTEPELFESDAQMLDTLVGQTGVAKDFQSLAAQNYLPWPVRTHRQFADLRFPTPSGRIEVASDRFLTAGLSREPQPTVEPLPSNGTLRVLSPASKWLMNSTFGNEPTVRRRFEVPAAWMHPDDAGRLELNADDRIEIVNETGAVHACVAISDVVPPGVLLIHKSSWPKLAADGVNVNALFGGGKTDTAESSAVHSVTARVRRAAGIPAGDR
jgi:anaerobic selenocysteine-containing dehydrogenase